MTTLDLPDLEAGTKNFPRVESALHGPAHPDEFRVKVGRFGDRWYHDPLPGCPLASASEDVWPSVTTIKKASGKDWSWVSLERAANYLEQRRHELDGLNAAEIHARLLDVNKAGLNRASDRGSSIHHVMEALAVGGDLPYLSDEARPYLPACQRFLDEVQPEWLLSEVVAISRTRGYGGTFDAVVRIDGKAYLVDWKTRKPGKHGAYEEEGWQLAAYAGADYIIVDRNGVAVREKMPHLDGAYVISLAPEGYRPYPVDLDKARQGFERLREFWDSKQDSPIGKQVRFTSKATAPDEPEITPAELLPTAQLRAWIIGRLDALKAADPGAVAAMSQRWPVDVPKFKDGHEHNDAELRAISDVLDTVERDWSIMFGPPDPTVDRTPTATPEPTPLAPSIDEGQAVGPDKVAEIIGRVEALEPAVKAALGSWAAEAHAAGVSFSIKLKPSQRRHAIYEALLVLAGLVDDDLERVRATVAAVVPDAAMPAVPLGSAIGALTIAEAEQLAAIAATVRVDEPAIAYDLNGGVHWATTITNQTEQTEQQEETNR